MKGSTDRADIAMSGAGNVGSADCGSGSQDSDSCFDRLSELAVPALGIAGNPTKCRDTVRQHPSGAETRQMSRRNGGIQRRGVIDKCVST